MGQRRGVGLHILLGDDVAVARHIGAGAAAEPAARLAHRRGARGLAGAVGIALAEQRLDHITDVGLEALAGFLEALLVEEHVVPLARGKFVRGIDFPVEQRHHRLEREARSEIGHAKTRHAHHLVGMVAGEVPHHGAASGVANPHGPLAAKQGQQLKHVGDDLLLREIVMARIGARPSVAVHVGRDATEAKGCERRQLMPPR